MPISRLGAIAKRRIEETVDAVAALGRIHHQALHRDWRVSSHATVSIAGGEARVEAVTTEDMYDGDPSILLTMTVMGQHGPVLNHAALNQLGQELRLRLTCLAPAVTDAATGAITLHLNPGMVPPRQEPVS